MRMSIPRAFRVFSSIGALCAMAHPLSGCLIPEALPVLGHDVKKRIFYDVVRGVQCEIRHAVLSELRDDRLHRWGARKLAWLEDWVAQMDLNLNITDKIGFHPGVSLKMPNWMDAKVWRADGTTTTVGQNYNFGIGAGIDYEANRYDKVQFAYDFVKFAKDEREDLGKSCYRIGGITIEGDLKLGDWLDDVLEPIKACAFSGAPLDPSEDKDAENPLALLGGPPPQSEACKATDLTKEYKGKNSPIQAFNHKITFTLTFDVNATPQWNLVRIAAGASTAGSPGVLFDANRKDYSELLISLAARDSKVAEGGHLALQIGSAVRTNQ